MSERMNTRKVTVGILANEILEKILLIHITILLSKYGYAESKPAVKIGLVEDVYMRNNVFIAIFKLLYLGNVRTRIDQKPRKSYT